MRPVICFFEKELFIYSLEYSLLSCPAGKSVEFFLQEIERDYLNDLKIVQVNFEYDDTQRFKKQKNLYISAKATVFLIKNYDLNTLAEIKTLHYTGELKTPVRVFKPLITKNEFMDGVAKIRLEITRGRIYQVNLTAPMTSQTQADPLDLFFHFESRYPSAYKAFLPFDNHELLSFSPELFLKNSRQELVTRPIKGSLSKTADFLVSLYKNKKEEAELSMIVDLLRNDLNSLGNPDPALVTQHRKALHLDYIQHTFSEIKLKNSFSLPYVLKKMMPGGSISGCPKLESLNVISEIEPFKRQAYTGTIGWWRKNDFKLNLSIRTFIKSGALLIYHSGCGIVFDSDAELEWKEFLLKTGGLVVEN